MEQLRAPERSRHANVLIVSLDSKLHARIAPVLSRRDLEVSVAQTIESAFSLLRDSLFHLVVIEHPRSRAEAEELIEIVQPKGSMTGGYPVLIVAEDSELSDLWSLVRVGRVYLVSSGLPTEELQASVSLALGVAVRSAVRLWVTLDARIGAGTLRTACQTVNLSRTGALVHTSRLAPLGSEVVLELGLPAVDEPLTISGTVVRYADPDLEGVVGMGIRFDGKSSRDELLLRTYLTGSIDMREEP